MAERIVIGSDHGGFELKEQIIEMLTELDYAVTDEGCFDNSSVNYPDIAKRVAEKISAGVFEKGVLICGTGIGMSLAANRFPRVRAALCHDHVTAKLSREHNDSNILAIGARVLGAETAKDILVTWLNTAFEGGRHLTRISMLDT